MPATSTSQSKAATSKDEEESIPEYIVQANNLAEERDADVILFNGPVNRANAHRLIQGCNSRTKRKNVFLLLTTYGGDPDAAYTIARHLQADYKCFTLFVSGLCKSAGTLMALGAHELVISNCGELGPLDVQLSKKDELGEKQSGLVGLDALTQLQRLAYDSFEEFFVTIKIRSGLTAQTCAKIATDLTNALFTPIYSQIDPLHLGETGRSMRVAEKYGERLIRVGGNISRDSVITLVNQYPSHDFVIDRIEADSLFNKVNGPSPMEQALADSLGLIALRPITFPGDTILKVYPHEEEPRKQVTGFESRQADSTKSTKGTNGGRKSFTERKPAENKGSTKDS